MEEVVKQLTPLIPTGPDWPYALVWLNRDACHVPLPVEGHLSIMVEGRTSSVTWRRISQLEVCQLLSLGSQVVYSVGLNGRQVPVIKSLPELLAKDTTLLGANQPPYQWTSWNPLKRSKSPKFHPLVATCPPSQLQAPSRLTLLRQKGRSAWPWRWDTSYPRWHWIPLGKHQGVPPQSG